MITQLKRPIVFLCIDSITFLSYYTVLLHIYSGQNKTIDELPFWGASIVGIIPIMIVSRIVLYMLYSIINSILTTTKEEKFLTDELGKLIKLRASRNFNTAFMLGFSITMGLLILGITLSVMFKLLFFSIFAAFTVQNLSEYYYVKKST